VKKRWGKIILTAKGQVKHMEMRARIALRKAGKRCNLDDVAAEVQKIKINQGLAVSCDDIIRAMSLGEEVTRNPNFLLLMY
jgi:hypothetical protein